MKYLQNNNIKNEVIEDLKDKLFDYEGVEENGCDLGYKLYEGENTDGCHFILVKDNEDWIARNFKDIGEIWGQLEFVFGKEYMQEFNPFTEPCKLVLIIFMEVASYLLGQCKTINKNWDNDFKLTKTNINKIIKELELLKD